MRQLAHRPFAIQKLASVPEVSNKRRAIRRFKWCLGPDMTGIFGTTVARELSWHTVTVYSEDMGNTLLAERGCTLRALLG